MPLPRDPVAIDDVPDVVPPITRRLAKYLRQYAVIPSWVVGHKTYFDRDDLIALVERGYRPGRIAAEAKEGPPIS